MSNIRSVASFIRSMPDWTEFNDCFEPSRIRISDIDGIVERNGQFLVLDAKKPGVSLTTGQRILYQQLAKKGFLVLVIFADMQNDVPSERMRGGSEAMIACMGRMLVRSVTIFYPNGTTEKDVEMDTAGLHAYIRKWFLWANQCTEGAP